MPPFAREIGEIVRRAAQLANLLGAVIALSAWIFYTTPVGENQLLQKDGSFIRFVG
jgi:hypothetical protein